MFPSLCPLQYITKTLTLPSLGLPCMCVCCSFVQLSLSLCMLSFPKMPFFSSLAYLHHAPNNDMCLIPGHLTFVCFLDLLGDHLECFLELCYLCLHLSNLLLKCVHYLDSNFITDQFHTLYLGLCYIHLGYFFLCHDFFYMFLQWFHLILMLLFM
jgi:hypothetical protein